MGIHHTDRHYSMLTSLEYVCLSVPTAVVMVGGGGGVGAGEGSCTGGERG